MMMVMMTLFMTLAMMTGSGLGSTCLRNEDCASACCSGYGWCVGSQSGDSKDIQELKLQANIPQGGSALDDCPISLCPAHVTR